MIRVIKWNSVDIGIGGYVDEGRFKYSACPVADDKKRLNGNDSLISGCVL